MGEIAINPIHNVHKKYRKVNLVNSYIFTPPVDLSTNTEIGGVASTISTPALLATKLGIDVSRITNFSIVGSDIKCKITGSYGIPASAFLSNVNISYYEDVGGLVNYIGNESFKSNSLKWLFLPAVVSTGTDCFADGSGNQRDFVYIPLCTDLGGTSGDNNCFIYGLQTKKIYCHPSLATNNGGAPDGDIAYAISQGATVRYVTNFTAPNPVTTLAAGTIYNTAIQLNFTAPSSTNAIEYYELYKDGVFVKNITVSGGYLTGLTPSTSYNFTLIAVDIFLNKSVVSNSMSVSTTNTVLDTDASAYMVASVNGQWQPEINNLFSSLKSNNLYNKIQAFYPFLGTTAAQHKWNAKNPLDTNAAFRLTFSGSATFSDSGYTPNGSTGYANTYLTPSVSQTFNSNGMTIVSGTDSGDNGDNFIIAAYNSGTQNSILKIVGNGAFNLNGTRILGSSTLGMKGIFTNTKQSATVSKLFKNGVEKFSGNSGGTLPTNPFYIGAIGNISYGYTRERIQFTAIHEGLSDAEVAILHTIIDIFEAALVRKTW